MRAGTVMSGRQTLFRSRIPRVGSVAKNTLELNWKAELFQLEWLADEAIKPICRSKPSPAQAMHRSFLGRLALAGDGTACPRSRSTACLSHTRNGPFPENGLVYGGRAGHR